MMRTGTIARKTGETDISLRLCLDGSGRAEISTGCGFLDHMLTLFAAHSGFDLTVTCRGDTEVDDHHTVEDIGIALGMAFAEAIGDKAGITRYGDSILPMDEALILASVDISGRGLCCFSVDIPTEKIGSFDTELCEEFFMAFSREARVTLHLRSLAGHNTHHILEACFKAVARALSEAALIDDARAGYIPSTKGVL